MIRLREFRIAKNLTQMQLAEMSGVSQSSIADIENGKKENPQIGTVLKLSRVLGCSMDELLKDENFDYRGKKIIALKRYRIKNKLTQVQLAERSGVSQSNIAAIESGKLSNPGVDTVLRLARTLGCTMEELVSGLEGDISG